jgi:hypothetical protein
MDVDVKDVLAWCATAVAMAGAFFHLRGRVSVIEALQKRDREVVKDGFKEIKDGFREIKDGLQRVEDKLDNKADK